MANKFLTGKQEHHSVRRALSPLEGIRLSQYKYMQLIAQKFYRTAEAFILMRQRTS